MINQQVLIRLRRILAGLYEHETAARRVVQDADLDANTVDFRGGANTFWNNILEEAKKRDKVERLITIACDEFPTNADLLRFVHEFAAVEAVEVPILIAAMTKDEAIALFDKTVFADENVPPIAQKYLLEFENELSPEKLDVLKTCYGSVREAWRPPYCLNESIEQIIRDIINSLNEEYPRPPNQALFKPQFISTFFFSEDGETRVKAIRQLEELGGILIIDAISMFHPSLSRYIVNASISAHRHVAIIVVSPLDAMDVPINKLIVRLFDRNIERGYARYREYDRLCDIDLGDLHGLKRWFFRTIPEAAKPAHQEAPLRSNLDAIYRSQGNKPRRDINPFALGAGGVS